jgi:hypothetical protein
LGDSILERESSIRRERIVITIFEPVVELGLLTSILNDSPRLEGECFLAVTHLLKLTLLHAPQKD